MRSPEEQILHPPAGTSVARDARSAILWALGPYAALDADKRDVFLKTFWKERLNNEIRRFLLPDLGDFEEIPDAPLAGLAAIFDRLRAQAAERVNEWMMNIPLPARIVVPCGSVSLRDWKKDRNRSVDASELRGKPAYINVGGSVVAAGSIEIEEEMPQFRFGPPAERLQLDASTVVLEFRAIAFRIHLRPEQLAELSAGSLLHSAQNEPVMEVFVGNRCVARGELVVVDEHFAIRITEHSEPAGSLAPAAGLEREDIIEARVIAGIGKLKLRDLILLEPGRVLEMDRPVISPWVLELPDGIQMHGDVKMIDDRLAFELLTPSEELLERASPDAPPALSEAADAETESTVQAVGNLKELLWDEQDSLPQAIYCEHPQTIAYILGFLPPTSAAQVLDRMPPQIRGDLYQRVARPAVVDARMPAVVHRSLLRKLDALHGSMVTGGPEFAEQMRRHLEQPLPQEEPGDETPPDDAAV